MGVLSTRSCLTLRSYGLQPTRLLCPRDFPGRKYWGGLLFPSPGDLPDPEIKLLSPVSPALAGGFFIVEPPGKSQTTEYTLIDSFSTEPVSQLLVLASVSPDGHWG